MNLVSGLILGAVYLVTIVAEGLGATWIGPERTYWPVLRLQKATLAAGLTWYVAVAILSTIQPGVLGKFVANAGGVVFVMLNSLYTLRLVYLRNHAPAAMTLDLTGIPHARRLDFEAAMLEAASGARHALLNDEQVDILAAGVERYRRMTPRQRQREREKAERAIRRRQRPNGGRA